MSREVLIPAADTRLYAVDAPGGTPALLFLSGGAAAADAEESNERVSVFATTPHKHTQILDKASDTVVVAIEDVIPESS